ncbi:MAG: ATP-binding protein [Balneolaceae bacterium]
MGDKFSLTGIERGVKQGSLFVNPWEEIRKPGIYILNRVCFFLLLVCVLFLIPFYFDDSVSLTWFFLSEALAFALIPILAKQGYINTAKLLLIAYIDIAIIVLSSVFGDEVMIKAFLIPTMGLSILLFDGKNIRLRNISIFFSVISYFVLDYIIFEQIDFSEDDFSIIRMSVIVSSFVTTWLIFNTFSEFKESAENKASELLDKEIELNKELSYNQERLKKNIQELEEARQDLEESTKAKSDFLATMSHEIRTPMNAIMGMTHLLQQEKPRKDQQEPLNILDFSGKTLLSLIDDVLDFSKIEAGRVEFESTEFELNRLVSTIMESFKVMASNNEIKLDKKIDPKIHNVLIGDPARLTQILNNLLSNALKFTEEGSVSLEINILDEFDGRQKLEFSVIDTGIGIPEERLGTIFESFTQASGSTKRLYGGTGLGLTISKQLAELQGGSIRVDSEEGKGSTFAVQITFDKGEGKAIKEEKLIDHEETEDALKGIKVLLAEDNIVNQKVMHRFLERWEIKMTIVDNGVKALEEVKKSDFDIILMDLQMPEMDGYEASAKIRKLEDANKRSTPIIALTAAALKEVREKVYASGMNDFVTKPFNPADLQQKMASHLK